MMHSTDRNQLERCKEAFNNRITKNEVDINLLFTISNEQELANFIGNFEREPAVVVISSDSCLKICGFTEKVNEIYSKCIEKM